MPRVVSFIVLLAIILLIGSMFFQVMAQFIVPLFLAAVLVVIFKPLHLWVFEKCGKRVRVSAAVTTLLIVLMVLLPLSLMVARAVTEVAEQYTAFSQQQTQPTADGHQSDADDEVEQSSEPAVAEAEDETPEDGTLEETTPNVTVDTSSLLAVVDKIVPKINEQLDKFQLPLLVASEVRDYLIEFAEKIAAPLALGGVQALISFVFGLAIMVLTLYYFFADGPNMVSAVMALSPLDDAYEQELLDKFADVSRSVVVAVLLSAVAQGLLAGIGYYFAGVQNVFLCTVLTCFLAMVPFVGATIIWVPICLVLYFYVGATTAAIVLAVYCATVVSMIDNLIKPFVLHGQANLHPLLALLSVIGGIQALGPIGILVGPMLVAFLQALLNMLNKELHLLGQESDATGKPVVFATAAADAAAPAKSPGSKSRKRGKKK